MRALTTIITVAIIALGLNTVTEGVLNAIVPNLSSGWFAKPGPTESIIFGFMVLKMMALRYMGVFPYHLNDFWKEDGFLGENILKRIGTTSRTRRDLFFAKLNKFSKAPFMKEIDSVERILLGLRRIDSHDCFIRHVCQIKQNQLAGQSSEYENTILSIFSLKPKREAAKGETSIWDIYHDALTPQVIDCNQKYKLCPLTKKEMKLESLMSGLF